MPSVTRFRQSQIAPESNTSPMTSCKVFGSPRCTAFCCSAEGRRGRHSPSAILRYDSVVKSPQKELAIVTAR